MRRIQVIRIKVYLVGILVLSPPVQKEELQVKASLTWPVPYILISRLTTFHRKMTPVTRMFVIKITFLIINLLLFLLPYNHEYWQSKWKKIWTTRYVINVKKQYSLRPEILVLEMDKMDVSITKISPDTTIWRTSIFGRREY